MQTLLQSLRLKHKLLALVLFMGLTPLIGTVLTFRAHEEQTREESRALQVQVGQAAIEKINQLVFAVVAESRAIYLAPTWADAKQFADGLQKYLREIDKITNHLAANAIESEKPLIAQVRKNADIFIGMREALVKAAREVSTAEGRAVGDTPETRRLRKELNTNLDKLSENYGRYAQDSRRNADAARGWVQILLAVSAGIPILGILIALFVVNLGLSRPVDGIRNSILDLADGKLKGPVYGNDRKDEIGDIAHAVGIFRDKLEAGERVRAEAESERQAAAERQKRAQEQAVAEERALVERSIGTGLARLAEKDLTFRLTDRLPEAYARLQADFNTAMETLEEALHGVRTRGTMIASTTREISSSADDLSRRTEQQAAALEETAAAVDQITATGKKSAEGASHAREVVAEAKRDAEGTGEVVRKTVDAMADIEKSAQQISQIIGVIDEIAFQTNLLALNAGVEAARAGDAGRGFAVVASEVRALAQRSAEAAKEIKTLIQASTAQVASGVALVAGTGKALERILGRFTEINDAVADIAAGTKEQATGLAEVNTSINQMDQTTQQNASMVEETTAASHTLAQEAMELSRLVMQFTVRTQEAAAPSRVAPARRSAHRAA
jgi:methyl-accepting chemotaxis protein